MGAPINSILEFRVKSLINDQECLTVLHYVVDTVSSLSSSGAEETAFLDAMDTGGSNALIDKYLQTMSTDATVHQLDAQFVFPVRLVNVGQTVEETGIHDSPCNNQNIAAVITRRTYLAGRSQVSDIHMPGVPDDKIASGFITDDWILKYADVLTKMLLQVVPATGGGKYNPVIWHRKGTIIGANYNFITSGVVQPTSRTMRRRTVGIGK